jgi:hypothetical protein
MEHKLKRPFQAQVWTPKFFGMTAFFFGTGQQSAPSSRIYFGINT